MITKDDLTIIYYTCNYLDEQNPVFLKNTKKQLVKAIGDLPLVVVSHKPVTKESFEGYTGEFKNIIAENKERSHLNIYRQILEGSTEAKTPFVAMAEDDILYSWEHFHTKLPPEDVFLYDMNKLSVFTWTDPPMYSFRHNRKVVNQLIAPRKMLVDAMIERFLKLVDLKARGKTEESIIHVWGDPGRYEHQLGVSERLTDTFMCTNPSIVFTHPKAFGYEFNHGKRKRLGDLRIIEIPYWGRAEEVLKFYNEPRESN